MKLSEKEYQFIRMNFGVLTDILKKRKADYEQSSIYMETVEEREKARLIAKECNYWIDLVNQSTTIKTLEEFTGI